MGSTRRPPAFVVALAWVFGVGAVATLASTPLLLAAGWLTRALLLRLVSEGLMLPAWYMGTVTALFALLVGIHLGVGIVSLIAARAFFQLRNWAWRWFHGLLWTSLIAVAALLLFAAIFIVLVAPRLRALAGGATPLPPGLALAGGAGALTGLGALLLSAVPVIVLLWLLRSAAVKPVFETARADEILP